MAAVLNLLVLRAADLERARRFYEALGLRFCRQRHGRGPEHLAAECGGVVFEVYPHGSGPGTAGVRLGFRVASVAEGVAAVQQLGAEVVTPAAAGPWGLRAVVVDPDGHRVEIVQASEGGAEPGAAADRGRHHGPLELGGSLGGPAAELCRSAAFWPGSGWGGRRVGGTSSPVKPPRALPPGREVLDPPPRSRPAGDHPGLSARGPAAEPGAQRQGLSFPGSAPELVAEADNPRGPRGQAGSRVSSAACS